MSHRDKLSDEERKARRKASAEKYRLANREKCVAAALLSRAKKPEEYRNKQREYRERCADKIKETSQKYRAENRDDLNAKTRQWQLDNQEKFRAYQDAYRIKNAGKEAERKRQWRKVNLSREAAYCSQWAKDHPELRRINQQNRRARIRRSCGRLSSNLSQTLMALQKGRCACCKSILSKKRVHLDHIMPLAMGGSNEDENIQLLCPTCNLSKSAKHPIDFMQRKGFLL